jgi:hypothetical protein
VQSNTDTVEAFYRAFQVRDHAVMADCYHPSVHFSAPVFTDFGRREVAALWHMLCERGPDLDVSFSNVRAVGDNTVEAHWEARYSFGPRNRTVHNKIRSSFVLEGGKIVRHVDVFHLWRWTGMALGAAGWLTGWTGPTQSKVRATARRGLMKFIDGHPEYR